MIVDEPEPPHLSRIETLWSVVLEAHHGADDRRAQAMAQVLRRYGPALHRYLLAVTGDADAAGELAQELALRLVRGDFRAASPVRGRFRQMIKSAALNLAADHHRRRRARPGPLGDRDPEDPSAATGPGGALDRQFAASWRSRLLGLAWASLRRHQERTGRPLYDVLRARAEHPGLTSEELAALLGERLGRRVTAGWARQALLRARERYAATLLAEVSRSLERPDPEALEAELIELGLLRYCRRHLARLGLGE